MEHYYSYIQEAGEEYFLITVNDVSYRTIIENNSLIECSVTIKYDSGRSKVFGNYQIYKVPKKYQDVLSFSKEKMMNVNLDSIICQYALIGNRSRIVYFNEDLILTENKEEYK